jgi:hypothetical protein
MGWKEPSPAPTAEEEKRKIYNWTIKPQAYKSGVSDEIYTSGNVKVVLQDINIYGTNPLVNKYTVKPYNENSAANDYIDLPEIGPFMMTKNFNPAAWVYWIGDNTGKNYIPRSLNGKVYYQPKDRTIEPINFIFVVKKAASPEDANQKIVQVMKNAGFPDNYSDKHTGGYNSVFKKSDGETSFVKQILKKKGTYETFENNGEPVNGGSHVRIFGPVEQEDASGKTIYIYSAAASKESPQFKDQEEVVQLKQGEGGDYCGHMYVSMTQAKRELSLGLLSIPSQPTHLYTTNLFNTVALDGKPDSGEQSYWLNRQIYTGDHQVTGDLFDQVTMVAVVDAEKVVILADNEK